jgi:DNA-binding transcriptional ArsR family regulator
MPMPDKHVPPMREILVVDDPDTIKLLFSGKYGEILDLIDSYEMAVSDIAKILKINPGSAHYHLKELEKRGLVEMVREETKGNIVKKYYLTVAHTISIDTSRFKTLRPGDVDPTEGLRDRMIQLLPAFGYDLPVAKAGALKDLMIRYNRRVKELQRGIQDAGIEKLVSDRLLIGDAYAMALRLAEIEDDGLQAMRDELRALLRETRGRK